MIDDELLEILRACSSTEPSTFNEFLRGLRSPPERGDKPAWAALFRNIDYLGIQGYIEIERDGDNRIESLLLTEDGIAAVKAVREQRRSQPTVE